MTDGQHRTIAPTTRKPSAALDAFIAEVEQDAGIVDSLTRKRVCEALAFAFPEDDIRMTDFNVRFREPSGHSPVGTLLIEHPSFPEPTQVAVTSVKAGAKFRGGYIPGTLFSVFHPMSTDILSVEEEVGCIEALRAASERMADERERHTNTRTAKVVRWVKHSLLG